MNSKNPILILQEPNGSSPNNHRVTQLSYGFKNDLIANLIRRKKNKQTLSSYK